jgi:hypothetical protein
MEKVQVKLHVQLTSIESILQLRVFPAVYIVRDIGGAILRTNFQLQALCFNVPVLYKEH